MKSSNFPTIDSISGGIARSVKILDINGKTYQNMNKLEKTLKGYVDNVRDFKGKDCGGDTVRLSDIKGRALDFAVPKGMSKEQQAVFDSVASYSKKQGVDMAVHVIK